MKIIMLKGFVVGNSENRLGYLVHKNGRVTFW